MGPCCRNADINDEPPALHIFPDMRSKANKKQSKVYFSSDFGEIDPSSFDRVTMRAKIDTKPVEKTNLS